MQPPRLESESGDALRPEPTPKRQGLRSLALRASAYEMLGFGGSQLLRLVTNIVLTRLLFPRDFALAALVAVYCQGLNMLSDVGIAASVVRSEEGDSEDYLNTAWTMSVTRGAVLYLIALALAWPAAAAFGEAQLGPLLAVGSAGIFISGFASTSVLTLRRHVEAKTLLYLDLTSQVIGLATTIVGAYLTRSVWALVVGTHVSALFRTLVTHFFIDVGYKNRFRWSKTAAHSITTFGKWIFLSSAFQFLAQQADRVFLGKMAGLTSLGIYSIAAVLSELGGNIVTKLTHQVLYPVLSRVYRESPERLADAYYKARLALDASVQSAAGLGCALAPVVISVLYDDRYQEAGWMLRVLMVRTAIAGTLTPCETCLFSVGQSRFGFVRSVLRVATVVIGLPLAMHYWGIVGVVWLTALGDLPGAIVMLYYFHKHGYLRPLRELIGPAFFGLGALVGWPIAVLLENFV